MAGWYSVNVQAPDSTSLINSAMKANELAGQHYGNAIKGLGDLFTRERELQRQAQKDLQASNMSMIDMLATARDREIKEQERQELKDKDLATNNALAVLMDPNKATSLHTPASELTTQNQIDMYNKANSDGIVTPQEQALMDTKYKTDLINDIKSNKYVDQKTLYSAEIEKAKMDADIQHKKDILAYQQKQLDATNSQNQWTRGQVTKQEKRQDNIAKAIILSSQPQNVTYANDEYTKTNQNLVDTKNKINTINDVLVDKLSPEASKVLSDISDKDVILNAAQKEKERLAYVDKNSIGAIYDDPTIMKPVVNQELFKLVKGNQELYDKLISDPTIVSNYKLLNNYTANAKQYEASLATMPKTVTKSESPSASDVANKILNDPNIDNISKLQALTLLGGEDNDLSSLFNTSGSNGKSKSGLGSLSLGGSANNSSTADKKYKAELKDKQAILYQNLKTIEEKNPNIPQNVLGAIKEANELGSPAAVQEVIKTYFDGDYLLKDSLEAKNKLIVKTLQSTINTKEDTDKDTMKNINAFVKNNEDVIKQLTPTQIETFLEKVKINYPSELGTFDFNWLGKSPIADSLSEVVDEHNEGNPNIKWNDLPF